MGRRLPCWTKLRPQSLHSDGTSVPAEIRDGRENRLGAACAKAHSWGPLCVQNCGDSLSKSLGSPKQGAGFKAEDPTLASQADVSLYDNDRTTGSASGAPIQRGRYHIHVLLIGEGSLPSSRVGMREATKASNRCSAQLFTALAGPAGQNS